MNWADSAQSLLCFGTGSPKNACLSVMFDLASYASFFDGTTNQPTNHALGWQPSQRSAFVDSASCADCWLMPLKWAVTIVLLLAYCKIGTQKRVT